MKKTLELILLVSWAAAAGGLLFAGVRGCDASRAPFVDGTRPIEWHDHGDGHGLHGHVR